MQMLYGTPDIVIEQTCFVSSIFTSILLVPSTLVNMKKFFLNSITPILTLNKFQLDMLLNKPTALL